MFINYATTDPKYYGINKKDYGVSSEKDMDETPLYISIREELTEIERLIASDGTGSIESLAAHDAHLGVQPPAEQAFGIGLVSPSGRLSEEQASHMLPSELQNEEVLLGPIASLCAAASLLQRKSDPETQRFAQIILADASKLVEELKRLGIVSPVANDPTR